MPPGFCTRIKDAQSFHKEAHHEFNKKLISLRKSMGLSQEELGAELKVSRQTISKWESGVSLR